jgi:hypothetical protein
MTILKRIIILYFSSIVAYIIISKLFGGQIVYMLKSRGLWLTPLLIILAGQIIGFVTALALEKPHLKQKIFNITYLIAFLGFVATSFYFKYTSWRHKRDFGNIEANQDHFKYFGGQYATEEKVAFDSLSKILVDPNSFELTGGNVHGIDTILNGHKQTIFFTTLRYKKENQETTLKAKFAVINNTAQLIYYDIPLDKEDNYRIDSLGKAVIKNFNDAMKVIPDSLKKEIKKDFGDIMDK